MFLKPVLFRRNVPQDCSGIEVGHVFYFGTKYSVPLGAFVMGPDGKTSPCGDGVLWYWDFTPYGGHY